VTITSPHEASPRGRLLAEPALFSLVVSEILVVVPQLEPRS
jgi:hypothetical protein